jgi:Zn-dependent protease
MVLSEQLLYSLAAVAIMLLIGFPVHEFSHAWTAYRLGDSTARYQGRLSLDPRVHFDPVGGMLLVISAVLSQGALYFGYAKPTPVNPMNLSGGRRGEAWVAAAGPISNLIMAAIVSIPLRLYLHSGLLVSGPTADLVRVLFGIGYFFVLINVFLFIFNLIPVPPLDGWRVLLGLVPSATAWQLRQFEIRYAQMIPFVFLIFLFLLAPRIIGPIGDGLMGLLLGI